MDKTEFCSSAPEAPDSPYPIRELIDVLKFEKSKAYGVMKFEKGKLYSYIQLTLGRGFSTNGNIAFGHYENTQRRM